MSRGATEIWCFSACGVSLRVSALGFQLRRLSQSRPQGRVAARGPADQILEGQGRCPLRLGPSLGLCSLQVLHVLCLISSLGGLLTTGRSASSSVQVRHISLAEAWTSGPLCGCAGRQVAALPRAELQQWIPRSQPSRPRARARLSASTFPLQSGLRSTPSRARSLCPATAVWESWVLLLQSGFHTHPGGR